MRQEHNLLYLDAPFQVSLQKLYAPFTTFGEVFAIVNVCAVLYAEPLYGQTLRFVCAPCRQAGERARMACILWGQHMRIPWRSAA